LSNNLFYINFLRPSPRRLMGSIYKTNTAHSSTDRMRKGLRGDEKLF
jgi:hypothetical protein